jgi:hypothetical protein
MGEFPDRLYHESDLSRVIGVTSATQGWGTPMDEPVEEYVGRHRLTDEADERSRSGDQVRSVVRGHDRTDTGQIDVSVRGAEAPGRP